MVSCRKVGPYRQMLATFSVTWLIIQQQLEDTCDHLTWLFSLIQKHNCHVTLDTSVLIKWQLQLWSASEAEAVWLLDAIISSHSAWPSQKKNHPVLLSGRWLSDDDPLLCASILLQQWAMPLPYHAESCSSSELWLLRVCMVPRQPCCGLLPEQGFSGFCLWDHVYSQISSWHNAWESEIDLGQEAASSTYRAIPKWFWWLTFLLKWREMKMNSIQITGLMICILAGSCGK